MKKILVVVDMQNDFIDGALGTAEAQSIVEKVINKINHFQGDKVYATRDTHGMDYLTTAEGQSLPIKHCIEGTHGWNIEKSVSEALDMVNAEILNKPVFGSEVLAACLYELYLKEQVTIEFVGLCTDICVVSNALLCKIRMPEAVVKVDATCCAGVTVASHEAALLTMKMCQIEL